MQCDPMIEVTYVDAEANGIVANSPQPRTAKCVIGSFPGCPSPLVIVPHYRHLGGTISLKKMDRLTAAALAYQPLAAKIMGKKCLLTKKRKLFLDTLDRSRLLFNHQSWVLRRHTVSILGRFYMRGLHGSCWRRLL